MMLNTNIKILTGWCAVSPAAERTIFPQLAQHTRAFPNVLLEWEALMEQLDASRLIRYWHRNRAKLQPVTMNFAPLTFPDSHVLWQGENIGRVQSSFVMKEIKHSTAYPL